MSTRGYRVHGLSGTARRLNAKRVLRDAMTHRAGKDARMRGCTAACPLTSRGVSEHLPAWNKCVWLNTRPQESTNTSRNRNTLPRHAAPSPPPLPPSPCPSVSLPDASSNTARLSPSPRLPCLWPSLAPLSAGCRLYLRLSACTPSRLYVSLLACTAGSR